MWSQYLARVSSVVVFIGKMFPKEKPSTFLPVIYNFLWMVRNLISLVYIELLFMVPMVVVQSHYLMAYFERDSFFRYLSLHLFVIFMLSLNFIVILGERIFYTNCGVVKTLLMSINPENENLKIKSNRHVLRGSIQKVHVRITIMIIILFHGGLLNYYFWTVQAEQNVLIVLILRPIFGSAAWKFWPYICGWGVFSIISMSIVSSIYFIYFFFQNQMALLILIDYIMQFRKKCNKEDRRILNYYRSFLQRAEVLRESEMDIMEHLKNIAGMYLKIQRSNNRIIKSNQSLHFLFLCASICFSFAIILLVFSSYEGGTLIGLINCLIFVFIGYILLNTVEDYNHFGNMFSTAYSDLSWYNWTVKCQKMYFIGTIHFSRVFKITLFLWIDVNRQLLQKVLRTLYPVMNLFYSLKKAGS